VDHVVCASRKLGRLPSTITTSFSYWRPALSLAMRIHIARSSCTHARGLFGSYQWLTLTHFRAFRWSSSPKLDYNSIMLYYSFHIRSM